jgi:NDP-sugar pyrophosphorylase family protein
MQAVILAGGLGTRLWPLTKTIPKPMMPVGNVPYLELQLRALARRSITDVVILTGHLGEQIEEYFGGGSRWGLEIRYSREETPLGTGGALRQAAPLLADTFEIIYGDSYLPIDYRDPVRRLEEAGAEGLLVVYDNRLEQTTVKNNVAVDEQGFVTLYDKDSSVDLDYVEAGVLAFRKVVLKRIRPEGFVSLEKEVFPSLIADRQLIAWATTQRFYDIGTPDRLETIRKLFAHDHHQDAISH